MQAVDRPETHDRPSRHRWQARLEDRGIGGCMQVEQHTFCVGALGRQSGARNISIPRKLVWARTMFTATSR